MKQQNYLLQHFIFEVGNYLENGNNPIEYLNPIEIGYDTDGYVIFVHRNKISGQNWSGGETYQHLNQPYTEGVYDLIADYAKDLIEKNKISTSLKEIENQPHKNWLDENFKNFKNFKNFTNEDFIIG